MYPGSVTNNQNKKLSEKGRVQGGTEGRTRMLVVVGQGESQVEYSKESGQRSKEELGSGKAIILLSMQQRRDHEDLPFLWENTEFLIGLCDL